MTSRDLEILSEGLSRLPYLHSVNFNFFACKSLQPKGLQYLCSALENSTALRNISFSFGGCQSEKRIVKISMLTANLHQFSLLRKIKLKFD